MSRSPRRQAASRGSRRAVRSAAWWSDLPQTLRRDLAAVALAGLGALGFAALYVRPARGVNAAGAAMLRAVAGRLAPLGPLALVASAAWLVFEPRRPTGVRAAGAALVVLAACGLAHVRVPEDLAFAIAWRGQGGGLLGASVDWTLAKALGPIGRDIGLVALALAGLLLAGQFSLRHALIWPFRHGARAGRALHAFVAAPTREETGWARLPGPADDQGVGGGELALLPPGRVATPTPGRRRQRVPAEDTTAAEPLPASVDHLPAPAAPVPALPGAAVPAPGLDGTGDGGATAESEIDTGTPPQSALIPRLVVLPGAAYQAPPLELLRKLPKGRPARSRDAAHRALQVEEALRSFGVAARVAEVVQGPSVTRFEVQPGAGVKVARISALADDLALALAATDVRIVAPIPGKAAVGIEVPNNDVTPVYLRDVLETAEFRSAASPLTVGLGQDIAGRPVVDSLQRLFHLLVAGATGSGKSITLNAMLVSILYKARPEEVKLVLIDPKMVELIPYNGIPHLLAPVVTDPRKAAATLRTVVKEMEKRYGLFTEAGARDLPRYNAIATEKGVPTLPYVVVVIDELADLMLVARSEVEDAIQRLTQMARAAGIHLIVATQRPSVDVITGVIKANIPSRIALTVSSQVDSRTILDAAGAERLVGRGDMLFRPVGAQKVVRAQGAFIADTEVEAVLDFLRSAGKPEYDTAIMEAEEDPDRRADEGEDDELFLEALQVVVESRQASVSNLQRRLRVGFTRAGRLVDMMEQRGFVGPHQGSKSREVLLTIEQFQRMFGELHPS